MEIINKNANYSRSRTRPADYNKLMTGTGTLPPQAKEIEEGVLGAIMLEKGAFDTVIELLKPEVFYVDAHQRIFKSMVSLSNKSVPIDMLTVVEELKATGDLEMVGGPYYINKLTNAVVSAANILAHARILVQRFIQRELIRISTDTISDSYDDSLDVFDLLDVAESRLFEITNSHLRQNFEDINTVLKKTIEHIEEMRNRKDEMTGVTSGFPKLDAVTYGWQQTDLIILAARPSVGKTAFALNLARAAVLNKRKPTSTAFFSLEMSSSQLVTRILSAESDIPMKSISRGTLEDHQMVQLQKKGITALQDAPLFIDDSPGLNIFELRAKCRRLKNKHNLGLVIIDYLQLMSGSGERNSNREQEISKISRDLKGLAKELKVPIIALSQLSREVEKRTSSNKMPQLSDLRESGAIEQDADMVMFLYRPEYHNLTQDEHGRSTEGQVQLKIAKHRNGNLETLNFIAHLQFQKFEADDSVEEPGGGYGNFKKIQRQEPPPGDGFIEVQSRMNRDDFQEDGLPFE